MIKKIFLFGLLYAVSVFGFTLASEVSTVLAEPKANPTAVNCSASFLTFPTWYRGLTTPDCKIKTPTEAELSGFIWTIVLNIVEIGTQAVAYLAVAYVLYGGFMYLTSSGSPDKASKARSTIRTALIGVVIATSASAIINTLSVVTTATGTVEEVIGNLLNIVYFVAIAIAFIMIIISGYKLTLGGSSPEAIKNAKNTLLYAIIGLIIVILAFAITTFVLDRLP